MTCDAMHGSGEDQCERIMEFTSPTIQGFDFLNEDVITGKSDSDFFQFSTSPPFDHHRKLDIIPPFQRHSTCAPVPPSSSSASSSSSSHEGVDQDAPLVPVLSHAEGMHDDGSNHHMCLMDTLEYMDVIEDVDIWDGSLLFGAAFDSDPNQQFNLEESLLQQQQFQQFQQKQQDVDMAVVFLDWLKMNKESISAEDLRKIKLKRSTIDCAARRLGGGKNGMKQLLMLILEWVKQHRLQKKNTDGVVGGCHNLFDHIGGYESGDLCLNPWSESQIGNVPEIITCSDSTIGGQFQPYQYFPETSPSCSSSQYSSGCILPENCIYPIQYQQQRPCDFRQNCNGRRFTGLGASATKEARMKRMARQRRGFPHARKHNHSIQPNLVMEKEEDSQIVDEHCSDDLIRGRNWMYCSKQTTPAAALTDRKIVTHPHVDLEYCQKLLESEDRVVGGKSENNMRFLLQKVLKQSDVGGLGRIVLPKKDAEANLPELEARDGISMAIEDIGTGRVWNMRYRFWPNNKSRMYLLENTGDFVRSNGLEEGDFIIIYSDDRNEKYMIRGVKACREREKQTVQTF